MLKNDELVGGIGIYRQEVRPFTDKQIELVKNFAAQAVIAIENTRLLNELRERTDDLSEALEQQTATSEVLKVISSSPGDLEPVFNAMLENATHICGAKFGILFQCDGNTFDPISLFGVPATLAEFLRKRGRFQPGAETVLDRILQTKDVVSVEELNTSPAVKYGGARSSIGVPMLKENKLVGAFFIYRTELRPFTDKQGELLSNFAAQAVIAIENTRLLNELRESLQQQTATADVLKVISSSPGQLEPVFQAMLENAVRICEASFGVLFRNEDGAMRAAAMVGVPPAFAEFWQRGPQRPGPRTAFGRVSETKQTIHIADVKAEPAYVDGEPVFVAAVNLGNFRTLLNVPMLKDNELIGVLAIYRQEVRPFTDKQIELLQNFAAQAVIAIENTRLLNELRETLERQTATSDVLKVISSSPGELKPVFEAMLANATRICEATFGNLWLFEGNASRAVAVHGMQRFVDYIRRNPVIDFGEHPTTPLARVFWTKQVIHIPDLRADESYIGKDSKTVSLVETAGARTVVAVPMLKDDELVGAIVIYRQELRPFTDKQIELLKNFAAQAVIAIENTRLLNELRESLQQQTATADVLKVISRSTFDLQPVLDTLTESAARLCDAEMAAIAREKDAAFYYATSYGFPADYLEFVKGIAHPVNRGSVIGRTMTEGKAVQISDVLSDPEYAYLESQKKGGFRTMLGVPLLREGNPIGVLLLARSSVRPFTPKQIELVSTFADQAVIAIENVRLFDEVQARTRDLSESLQQQTATADVLKVISRSTFDLPIVLDTLTELAARLCGADRGVVFQRDGDLFRFGSSYGFSPDAQQFALEHPIRPDRGSVTGRAALEGKTIHIPDVLADPEYRATGYQKAFGYRTNLGVPLLREGTVIGVFALTRDEVNPFTEKQIELATTFADQAVIAIENARLFDEVQARTRDLTESLQQQTATADVLKVISRSTFDLRTVLQTLIESAARFCDAEKATILREKDGAFYRTEVYGFSREFMDYVKDIPIEAERGSASGRALLEGRVVHIADVKADPEYTLVEAQKLGDYRTILCVPMLREGIPIGVLVLTRSEVRPFTDKQIELVTTFADQAAIAIENVRLFESVEARTRELAKSLEELRTMQDRLVQTEKLASLGQLTAGIAHEIKNPLNFVNNFSAVSAELIDELRQALAGAKLNKKLRAEISEIADMLQGNLDKVVQHGKRADAIVKNMLLHSRQGSGEHRPVDVNALVEESLNLAYHGARAEKQGFNITLETSFDPTAGEADVFPQEITRALLNLISNGFYAATKRKPEANGGDYEPTLAATTKNLGDRVEIRIRDNGTGIPPEVKDKLFSPFFTTKPAGEGTGLGLSISHDIIVKQHGGSIEVDTQPGEFTEFRITLPRAAVFLAKLGGRG